MGAGCPITPGYRTASPRTSLRGGFGRLALPADRGPPRALDFPPQPPPPSPPHTKKTRTHEYTPDPTRCLPTTPAHVDVGAEDGAQDGGRLHDEDEVPVDQGPVAQRVPAPQVDRQVGQRASHDGDVGQRHGRGRVKLQHHQVQGHQDAAAAQPAGGGQGQAQRGQHQPRDVAGVQGEQRLVRGLGRGDAGGGRPARCGALRALRSSRLAGAVPDASPSSNLAPCLGWAQRAAQEADREVGDGHGRGQGDPRPVKPGRGGSGVASRMPGGQAGQCNQQHGEPCRAPDACHAIRGNLGVFDDLAGAAPRT